MPVDMNVNKYFVIRKRETNLKKKTKQNLLSPFEMDLNRVWRL